MKKLAYHLFGCFMGTCLLSAPVALGAQTGEAKNGILSSKASIFCENQRGRAEKEDANEKPVRSGARKGKSGSAD